MVRYWLQHRFHKNESIIIGDIPWSRKYHAYSDPESSRIPWLWMPHEFHDHEYLPWSRVQHDYTVIILWVVRIPWTCILHQFCYPECHINSIITNATWFLWEWWSPSFWWQHENLPIASHISTVRFDLPLDVLWTSNSPNWKMAANCKSQFPSILYKKSSLYLATTSFIFNRVPNLFSCYPYVDS
jgi:hypothetical protein